MYSPHYMADTVKTYTKPAHFAGLVQISPGQFSPGPDIVGIGLIPVQKLLGLQWTGLGRTWSGLVQCWTGGIIGVNGRLPNRLTASGNNNEESIYILQNYSIPKQFRLDPELADLWGCVGVGEEEGHLSQLMSPPILVGIQCHPNHRISACWEIIPV